MAFTCFLPFFSKIFLEKIIKKIIIGILMILFISNTIKSAKSGCQADPTLCDSKGGVCTRSGLCLCNDFYYGEKCNSQTPQNERVEFINGTFGDGDIAGIVIGWAFLIPGTLYIAWEIAYHNA